MLITADQIRAARALKNWSQTDLADRTGLAVPTIANIELGKQIPGKNTIEKIVAAFTASGIMFLQDEGVQKMKSQVTAYRGTQGFIDFVNNVDQTAMELGSGEFLVSNVNEKDFMKWVVGDIFPDHTKNILSTKVRYKILIQEGDHYTPAESYAEYRWTPKDSFFSVPVYVFGDKVGIFGFEKDDINIYVLQDEFISKLYRKQFNELWERSKKITQIIKKGRK